MGEYYNWVNVDKKEYICPSDFDCGNKFHESMHKDSVLLHALHSLLDDEWKGNRILWLGDECSISEQSSNAVLKALYEQSAEFGYPGYVFDMICESYKNISCFFKEAEKDVREEIGYYLEENKETGKFDYCNEYGINPNNPYEGLFLKNAKRFTFTINYSKEIYYNLYETEIFFQNHNMNDSIDPLPCLLSYGRVFEPGDWLGDVIGVSNQRPDNCSLIREIVVY